MVPSATPELLIERQDGVLVLTFNRPEAKNAMTLAISKAMAEALDLLDSDISLRVAVVTGAGGTFCSGMDLKTFCVASGLRCRAAASAA
jgi:enoyl-CoA hydratase